MPLQPRVICTKHKRDRDREREREGDRERETERGRQREGERDLVQSMSNQNTFPKKQKINSLSIKREMYEAT